MKLCRILTSVLFALIVGPLAAQPPVTVASPALRLHWLGLPHISADTNAAQFLKIWHLPETVTLVNQTLDKLSRWPGGGVTNTASQSLRPLLDDLIASEFYVEVFTPTNSQPSTLHSQLLLALRLPSARADLWQTNLATAFTALTSQKAVASKTGWRLAATRYGQVELARAGAWTVLTLGPASNERMPSFIASLPPATGHASPAGDWLEADLDLPRLTDIRPVWLADLKLPLSGFKFQVAGEQGEVLTRGTFTLSQPWTAKLPAWQLPTNFLHQSTASFTALRGLAPWLAQWPIWQKTGLQPAPDQAYFWSAPGVPFQTYGLIPLPGASNQLSRLSARLVGTGNSWLASHAQGNFQWLSTVPVLVWKDAMIISPWLKADQVNHQDCLLAGLYALPTDDNTPPLPGFLQPFNGASDMVYFQTEQTGARVEDYFFITQVFRIVFNRSQLPPGAAATQWLKHIEPLLGASTTELVRRDPQTLAVLRRSTVGLTALELHLLADWLESPAFPCGLHTFLAPPDQK